MKKLLLLLAFSSAAVLSAQEKAAPAPGIDPVATEVWRQHIEGMGDRGAGAQSVRYEVVSGKALEFFRRFPNERRVSGIMFNLASFGDWLQGENSAELRAGWQQHLKKVLAETLEKEAWPDQVWAGLHWVAAKNDQAIAMDATGRPDLRAVRERLAVVAVRAPAAPHRLFTEQMYVELLERFDPGALEQHLQELARSEVADIANLGRGQLAVQALKREPMELKFTALDGKPFDLAQLRGKVVLIDCWATWCVPCIKELPNVKAALAKWGDKGFAVVGISFDRVGDRAKLEKFVADEKLAWPHWFNEAGGSNPFGKKYSIRSIPATFLLDRDGRLVTTDTHGPRLEAVLQKLIRE